ncbi:hypothetical protein CSAL01_12367 [Colletotrichum salicis]|uniref:Uncharacterized protein n=1 Tax=Colletotrichum salicis TaxID=1209931 RepID=A0A135V6B5_9PEZI|nr:hypothetical protein CSAL01_12367 [Colletotrichum salicis]
MRFSLTALLAMATVALANTTPPASTTTGAVNAAAAKGGKSASVTVSHSTPATHSTSTKNAGPRETAAIALGVMVGGMGLAVKL